MSSPLLRSKSSRVRPQSRDPGPALGGAYQIVSGHNRTTAARRAGLKQIPAWVREMDDDTAFMQLLLSNTQGELSPLERGMHALAATEMPAMSKLYVTTPTASGYRNPGAGGIERGAGGLVHSGATNPSWLDRTRHLAEIHAAPEPCWPALITRMLDGKWTVEQTNAAVKAVIAVKPPRGYEKFFASERLQEMAAAGRTRTKSLGFAFARSSVAAPTFATSSLRSKSMPPSSKSGWRHPAPGMSARSPRTRSSSSTISGPCGGRAKPRSPSSSAR